MTWQKPYNKKLISYGCWAYDMSFYYLNYSF
uniref:S protein n=1 Tax=Siphoviridae sp. ctOOe6 TaxID=2826309 RepID=A0A8S5LXC8_9CAUD|nr:MAG TPA: S protein [Siphoviridae sp. ctOOe6]